ncbi:MAG: hypothetical protein RIR37_117 [Verrucomicrobiota bacterium]|jgi:hypothetical protein
MILTRHICYAAMLLITASCSTKTSTVQTESTHKPFSQRLNEQGGYSQDSEGNWKIKGNKRSSFESQGASPYFKGEYQKEGYKTGEYATKSWWGNKDYGRKNYDGNTDGSRFMTSSALDGKKAGEADTAAKIPGNYQTNDFATGAANEAGTQSVSKPTDTETDVRRRVFQQPDIIDWREQRQLSVEQSKGLLGR